MNREAEVSSSNVRKDSTTISPSCSEELSFISDILVEQPTNK